jgi:hypothetical protein
VLEPVVARYQGIVKRLYFRGDAAFANPEMYEFLETEGAGYTIRLPAKSILQNRIAYLLKRPVGRPPHEVRRHYASFTHQAQSWSKPRRVVAKVVSHGRYVWFQMAEVAVPRQMFAEILSLIGRLRAPPAPP